MGSLFILLFPCTDFFPAWSHAARREEPFPLPFTFSSRRNRLCFNRSRNWVWISLTRCVFPLSLLAEPAGSRSATITHDFPVEGHLHSGTVCKFCLLVCGLCVCFSSVIGSLGKSPWWLCCQGWVLVFPCCESRSLIHFGTVNFPMP